MRRTVVTVIVSSLLTLGATYAFRAVPGISRQVLLENERVRVTERVIPLGGERTTYVRDTDQIIVFLNETTYERTDPVTGATITRQRTAGEVLWHDRAEQAPKLVNTGNDSFRSLIIALK
jgi:hypothetical protein